MVRLEFHPDIADPLGYCCRLLRKAYRRGVRVVVCGQAERLSRLDTLLWTFEQLEFAIAAGPDIAFIGKAQAVAQGRAQHRVIRCAGKEGFRSLQPDLVNGCFHGVR